jgi:hypothetical protein
VSRRAYLVAVVLLAAVAWWFWPRAAAPGRLAPAPAAAHPGLTGGGTGILRPHANPNPPGPDTPPIADAPSELADKLNSPATDIHADLRLLNEIFVTYRGSVHAQNPVGDNIDITAVLTGRNSLGFAFIPKDNPAINANGELCDRWGTPFFFHQMSGEEMEIRSAGPDRKLWTADDEVLSPNAP